MQNFKPEYIVLDSQEGKRPLTACHLQNQHTGQAAHTGPLLCAYAASISSRDKRVTKERKSRSPLISPRSSKTVPRAPPAHTSHIFTHMVLG